MGTCSNCGFTGSGSSDCPSVTSSLLYDGAGLCIGISSGTLNDIIMALANAICALSGGQISLPIKDSDVALTTSGGSCLGALATLDLWIAQMEALYCAAYTTFNSLRFTEPVYFNVTPESTALIGVAYEILDTYTLPKNSLYTDGDYLEIETEMATNLLGGASGAVKYKVTFGGSDAVIFTLNAGAIGQAYVYRGDKIKLTRYGTTKLAVDWKGVVQTYHAGQTAEGKLETALAGVDFTVDNDITIEAYSDVLTKVVTQNQLRITKFVLH